MTTSRLAAISPRSVSAASAAFLHALPALHHVQHDLLEIRLPADQGLDLRLQVLQLSRGRDLAGLQPLAVPVDAGPHLLDICLGLDLTAPEIALLGLERGHGVAQLVVPLLQLVQLGVFRKPTAAVLQPGKLGVQVGQFKQPQLRLGRCFHGDPR